MNIKEINVGQFKSIRNHLHLTDLSSKVNIIYGKNGAGKSNILSCINVLFNAHRYSPDEKQILIHDANLLSTNKSTISVNIIKNDRFPFKESFSMRRELSLKQDIFYICEDGLIEFSPSRDEMHGILESSNLTNNSLFFIQQGKITHFAMLSDEERFSLIKEIAGANVYERDRKESYEMLMECDKSIEKMKNMLGNINDRIKYVEKDKEILIKYEANERIKQCIESAISLREVQEIDTKLSMYKEILPVNEEINEYEEIEDRILDLKRRIENNNMTGHCKNIDSNIFDDIKGLSKEEESLRLEKVKLAESLEKLKNNSKATENEASSLDLEKEFYREVALRNHVIDVKDEINISRDVLREIETKDTGHKKDHEAIDSYKLLEEFVEKRNELWTLERRNVEKRKVLKEDYQRYERNLIQLAGNALVSYQEIRHLKGVHGCVYELISLPEELYIAIESVAGGSLFNVVVDDDTVATDLCKNLKGRITFIPLNRIKSSNKSTEICNENYYKGSRNKIPSAVIEDAILLSSQIKCREEYKEILNFITRDSYLVSDLKSAINISKMHNVNTVTIEGDFISKNGSITGGFEKKQNLFGNFKEKEREIRMLDKRQNEIQQEVLIIEKNIKELKGKNDSHYTIPENVHNYEPEKLFHLRKIDFLRKLKTDTDTAKFINLSTTKTNNRLKDLEIKQINMRGLINQNEIKIRELKFKHQQVLDKLKFLKKSVEEFKEMENYNKMCLELKELENEKIKRIYTTNKNEILDIGDLKLKIDKNVLLERKANLLRKINQFEDDHIYDDLSLPELYGKLKEVTSLNKREKFLNRRAVIQFEEFSDQRQKLSERYYEIIEERQKISEFISELDIKKSEKINLTFSMIKDNFTYFYSKLSTAYTVGLELINDSVSIKINGELQNNLKKLSGGQKTLLALSLIFSIQKIDPAPFYLLDEIDANLDKESRINVARLIREMAQHTQFFVTTFREEMLQAGDKFYCVEFENKTTTVNERSIEDGMVFLGDNK